MSDNKLQPGVLLDVEILRPLLKQIHRGKAPHEIKGEIARKNIDDIIKTLVEDKLVDHLGFVAAAADQVQPGTYFLTDKGLRWLRTYDPWERFKHGLTKWQLLWGIILGVFINMISNLIWPYLSCFISWLRP